LTAVSAGQSVEQASERAATRAEIAELKHIQGKKILANEFGIS
jgi:hypothetical protein